jgi:uncharacterized protein YfdQ (DUF2303 family)
MTHETEAAFGFEKGRQTILVEKEVNGILHLLVPGDCTLKSMEDLMPAPARIKASPEFLDANGFAEYVNEFKEEGSRVFVDLTDMRLCTVFDCHAKDKPAWGDHSASLALKESHEWQKFKGLDNKQMSNTDFAEFIEDHLAYIANDDLSGSDLLSMAQNLKVELKGELAVESTLHAGLRNLTIRDDHVMQGKVGEKSLAFPEKLKLKLRIFQGGETYPIEVYVRYRASKEGVKFWIKIPDPAGIKEEAFNVTVQNVRELTRLPVLNGSFQGKSHRR